MKQRVFERYPIDEERFYKEIEQEAAVNKDLLERIEYIDSDTLLYDETFRYSQEEMLDLSREYEIAMNMDKKDLAVFVVAAFEKFPHMVFQCLSESIIEERGKR